MEFGQKRAHCKKGYIGKREKMIEFHSGLHYNVTKDIRAALAQAMRHSLERKGGSFMSSRTIHLRSVEDIKSLCAAAVKMPFDIDVLSENYVIDAKSIMGIFALDRAQPMAVRIDADDAQAAPFWESIAPLCE